jgi:hypothetical protein
MLDNNNNLDLWEALLTGHCFMWVVLFWGRIPFSSEMTAAAEWLSTSQIPKHPEYRYRDFLPTIEADSPLSALLGKKIPSRSKERTREASSGKSEAPHGQTRPCRRGSRKR